MNISSQAGHDSSRLHSSTWEDDASSSPPGLSRETCLTETDKTKYQWGQQGGKMTQGVKVLASRPVRLSSVPGAHMVEGEGQFPQSVLWAAHAPWHACVSLYAHKINKWINKCALFRVLPFILCVSCAHVCIPHVCLVFREVRRSPKNWAPILRNCSKCSQLQSHLSSPWKLIISCAWMFCLHICLYIMQCPQRSE